MEKNFYANHATSAWLRYAAPAVVAAFFSTAVYAQEAPSKPCNLKATETSGYVTLSWDRFAKADTLLNEGFELIQKQGVRKYCPAMSNQWLTLVLAHSSSADSGASRSISLLSTSE